MAELGDDFILLDFLIFGEELDNDEVLVEDELVFFLFVHKAKHSYQYYYILVARAQKDENKL